MMSFADGLLKLSRLESLLEQAYRVSSRLNARTVCAPAAKQIGRAHV